MKPIESILAAVDFSESSNSAFKAAIGLAKLFSAELHVVHAFEAPLPHFSPYGLSIPPDFISEARDVAARKLEKSCQMATAAGVSVEVPPGHRSRRPAPSSTWRGGSGRISSSWERGARPASSTWCSAASRNTPYGTPPVPFSP